MSSRTTKNTSSQITSDYLVYNINGVSKADVGKYEEALNSFSKAIEINPDNFVSYFNRASIKMSLGDIEGARVDFKKSELLNSTDYYA